MRTSVILLAMVLFLVPRQTFAQESSSRAFGEVIGTTSTFLYANDVEKWRKAFGGRIRWLPKEWTHLELGYTRAWTHESISCLLSTSCPRTQDNPSNLLSVTAGFRTRIGEWVPYFGIGTGGFWNDGMESAVFLSSLGLQREIGNHLGLLGEYRSTLFPPHSRRYKWNHELTLGLVFKYP